MLGREIESRDAIKEQVEDDNSYRKQMKKLDEHTDVYLYGEQSEYHHSRLDLMTKQSVLD